MKSRSPLSALLLIAVALSSFGARAETALDPAATSSAAPSISDVNAAVKRGIELRHANEDEEALEVFLEALRRAPESVRIRVHLAATYQALGKWLEADRYLREALQHTDDPYIVRHRLDLERALDYVGARLGGLEVRGSPAGASVFLSGRFLGTVPLDTLAVPTGSYVLEVRKDGYYPTIRTLDIASRGLLRERVELASSPLVHTPVNVPLRTAPPRDSPARTGSSWLIPTLGGVGAASAVMASVAWMVRESAAARWNSADCLEGQRTRGDNCAGDLDRGRVAERVAIVGGVGAGLFLGAAAAVFWFSADSDGAGDEPLSGCFPGVGGVSCVRSF